jgi:hypothetical protein
MNSEKNVTMPTTPEEWVRLVENRQLDIEMSELPKEEFSSLPNPAKGKERQELPNTFALADYLSEEEEIQEAVSGLVIFFLLLNGIDSKEFCGKDHPEDGEFFIRFNQKWLKWWNHDITNVEILQSMEEASATALKVIQRNEDDMNDTLKGLNDTMEKSLNILEAIFSK